MSPIDQIRERTAELAAVMKMLTGLDYPSRSALQARHDALVFAGKLIEEASDTPAPTPKDAAWAKRRLADQHRRSQALPPDALAQRPMAVEEPAPSRPAASAARNGDSPWTADRLALAKRMWRDGAQSKRIREACNALPGVPEVGEWGVNHLAKFEAWPARNGRFKPRMEATAKPARPRKNSPWTTARVILANQMWLECSPTSAICEALNRLPATIPVSPHKLQLKAYNMGWPSRKRGPKTQQNDKLQQVGAAETNPTDAADESEACDMICQHKGDAEIAEYFGWREARVAQMRQVMIAAGTYEPPAQMKDAA